MAANDPGSIRPDPESRGPGAPATSRGTAPHVPATDTGAAAGTDCAPRPAAPRGGPAELTGSFGRYRILKKLGQGGMGTVYLAEDAQLDRRVALKVPRLGAADAEVLARFYREARAAATIDHPNVCPVHDVGEIGGVHYVTMAYVEGRPLSDLLRDGKPLPQRPVAAVVRKLALALQEAHARGVIHRDLKPANVMINRRKEPVVMDFGLALREDRDVRLTHDGMVIGTPAYMPPEQVRGDLKAMGPGCDVYSLGVILYQMLTGRLPFQGPMMAVFGQVLTENPPPAESLRPDLDAPLAAVCRKAMAKEPRDRYASMAEFAAALTDYLRSEALPTKTAEPAAAAGHDKAAPPDKTSDDAKVTELLGRLLDRLEAAPATATLAPEPPPRSLLLPVVLVVGLLLAVGGVAIYLLTRTPPQAPTPPAGETRVVVQLQGLAERAADPAVHTILLDGRPVTREQLAGPIDLQPGEHELILQRADGSVIGSYKFAVSREDDGRQLPAPAPPPAPPPAPSNDPAWPTLDPANLKASDIGNVAALEQYFAIRGIGYDPAARRVILTLEARRAIDYVPREVRLEVRLYDGDDARVRLVPLGFDKINKVMSGETVRAHIDWGQTAGVKRVLLVAPGEKDFPAGKRPSDPKFDRATLPAGIEFDLAALDEAFIPLNAAHDPASRRITLLLEARRPIAYVPRDYRLEVHCFDAKGARLRPDQLSFGEHVSDLLKGERVRASFSYPAGTAKATLVRTK